MWLRPFSRSEAIWNCRRSCGASSRPPSSWSIASTARLASLARSTQVVAEDRWAAALVEFVTTGIDVEQRAQIGRLPHGDGILGVLGQGTRAVPP